MPIADPPRSFGRIVGEISSLPRDTRAPPSLSIKNRAQLCSGFPDTCGRIPDIAPALPWPVAAGRLVKKFSKATGRGVDTGVAGG